MLSKEYLLQRGYCCGHGCLMCPYEPKHQKDNTNLREEFMSKANSNFDHLKKDPYGKKETKGTYYQINKLEEKEELADIVVRGQKNSLNIKSIQLLMPS